MKVLMGMAQAVFGIIWIGFVGLITVIGIGVIITKEAFDWFKKINNETNEEIKEYYKNIEKKYGEEK